MVRDIYAFHESFMSRFLDAVKGDIKTVLIALLLASSFVEGLALYVKGKNYTHEISSQKQQVISLTTQVKSLEETVDNLSSERDRWMGEANVSKAEAFEKDLNYLIGKLNSQKNYNAEKFAIYLEMRAKQIKSKNPDIVELMKQLQDEYTYNESFRNSTNYWCNRVKNPSFMTKYFPLPIPTKSSESQIKIPVK